MAFTALRGSREQKLVTPKSLVDAVKGQQKKKLSAVEVAADAKLQTIDTFIAPIKADETSSMSHLSTLRAFSGRHNARRKELPWTPTRDSKE